MYLKHCVYLSWKKYVELNEFSNITYGSIIYSLIDVIEQHCTLFPINTLKLISFVVPNCNKDKYECQDDGPHYSSSWLLSCRIVNIWH